MFYQRVTLLTLLFSFYYLQAIPCSDPSIASNGLLSEFRYGCFCGKNYPNIQHPSKKNYKNLNKRERDELVQEYQRLDSYDDIDQVCKEHDICYIMQSKEAKVCNDQAYVKFTAISKQFSNSNDQNLSKEACRNLSYDMASIFHTIFLPTDDENTMLDLGMLLLNSAVTVSNRILEESLNRAIHKNTPRYPLPQQRCLLHSLKTN